MEGKGRSRAGWGMRKQGLQGGLMRLGARQMAFGPQRRRQSFPKMGNPRRDRREIRGMLNLKCLAVARKGLKKS